VVRLHDDVFVDSRTKDEIWLPYVAAQGWIALSHNKSQRRVKIERDAAMNAGATVFYLIGKDHDDVILNLIATVPRIIRFREKHEPPFLARVTRPDVKFVVGSRPGNVEMALTKSQWLDLLAKGR
jgi:hypothetical protein